MDNLIVVAVVVINRFLVTLHPVANQLPITP
jgi:hypothetical protein